jgi:hypothetical protein
MRIRIAVCFLLFSCLLGTSLAQDQDIQKSHWRLGVIFKLEKLKQTAIEVIQKYEAAIQQRDLNISRRESVISLVRQEENAKVCRGKAIKEDYAYCRACGKKL